MAVELRYPRFNLAFYTEKDEYHITYDAQTGESNTSVVNKDNDSEVSNNFMIESVISLTTKNAMEDDSAVFSFVLAGDVYWDRILKANDAVVLRLYPDITSDLPVNPVLLVGLISEVRLEGDYGENSKMYRITGQSFAKALMQFDLGVIQEVSVVLTDIGWLPDDAQEGVKMTGRSASQLAEGMMNRFLQYMKFDFNGKGLERFLEWELDSWTEAERLIDNTPYINYEGSLKQLLDDITAKPFNELFFDATPENRCRMIMRRTPFDKADWENLTTYTVTSKEVISESVATNDTEAYSIFNISINNLYGTDSMMLGSKPQVFPALVNKYGYKKLEVDNKYLQGAIVDSGDNADSADTNTDGDTETNEDTATERRTTRDKDTNESSAFDTTYGTVMNYLRGYPLDILRVKRGNVRAKILQVDRRITGTMADKIIDQYIMTQSLTKEQFTDITGINEKNASKGNGKEKPTYKKIVKFLEDYKDEAGNKETTTIKNELMNKFNLTDNQATSIASEFVGQKSLRKTRYDEIMKNNPSDSTTVSGSDTKYVKEFTKRLANWYCENPNFYSGDIVVKGSPDYRLGGRLFVVDEQNNELWEYYIESVEHTFSYTQGYTTTLGVTRGLKNGGKDRFTHLWGKSEDFSGGMLGEKTLEALLEDQEKKNNENNSNSGSSGGSSGGTNPSNIPGGTVAMKAVNWGRSHSKTESSFRSAYDWGGGRTGRDPFESSPIATDCSSFVWWCFKHAGVELNGGATGMTTWSIIADTKLETIATRGQKNSAIFDKMKAGDIIWFRNCEHIGIYCGEGKMVACNGSGNMNESPTAGIIVSDMTSGYWWDTFDGDVKRYN